MKKLVTKVIYVLAVITLFLGQAFTASAQYAGTSLETGGLYTALAKDGSNNVFVTRVTAGTSGATYEVAKYTGGTGTPTVIYSGLSHEISDFPWGLVVDHSGNVYVATDFTSGAGSIIKLTLSGGTYTPSTFQTGRYFSALALDLNNNLYTAEYDATNNVYAVVKYASGSAALAAGTVLYDNLKVGAGYAYPTGLTVANNGDIYVADAFSNTPSINDGGRIYKLTKASAYAVSTVSTGNYSTELSTDANNNLYSTENRGTGYELVVYAGGTGSAIFSPLHSNGIYYPWGLQVFNAGKIFLADGDDGTNGGSLLKLSYTTPSVTTAAVTALGPVSATLNGQVNDNGNTTTVSFTYGTSATLAGATTTPATTGGTVNAGSGNTAVALNLTGLTGSSKYYYRVTATSVGGTVTGSILSFTTTPSISYTSPDVFVMGTTITPLTPVTTTVPSPSYGTPVAVGSGFLQPFGVAVDATGNLYVADNSSSANAIYKIPAGGGSPVALATGLSQPGGVAVDGAGNVYFTEYGSGALSELVGGAGAPVPLASSLNGPYGVAVDATGNLFVASFNDATVYKIPAGGGAPVAFGSGYSQPVGVTIDASGNVLVADYGNSTVKRFNASGSSSTALGSGFNHPTGVAVDGGGNIYIADYLNGAVKVIRPGTSTPVTVGSGFAYPESVAVDAFGDVYLSESGGAAVKEVMPAGGFYLNTALPRGLSFNVTTGVISGTPAVASPATNYIVSAYNTSGSTQATVNIKVLSTNADLTSLHPSRGPVTPAFVAGTTSYTINVVNGASSMTFAPVTADANATLTINGISNPSGVTSAPVSLNVGSNVINIVVTAQDGVTTKTYTITVTRAASSVATLSNLVPSAGSLYPIFSPGSTGYTETVTHATATMTVTPTTTDPTATVTVNGTAVTSGTASASLPLTVGTNNINIVVTAQDGTTTQTYTITVLRPSNNASLSALHLNAGTLSPTFSPATTSYTENVVNGVSSISITPSLSDNNASLTINGAEAVSGDNNGPYGLNVGPNTFTIVVTAQDDATQKTYTIVVNRAASSNASLSALHFSAGVLSPAFSSTTTSYTESVVNGVSSVTVTPTTFDVNSRVTINGVRDTTGVASGPFSLNVGPNVFTVVVTAQDGVTQKTYTTTITRAPSANANLSALHFSAGTLSPAFSPNTLSYTSSVVNGVGSVTVTPTTADATATVTVNGTAVASGTATAPIHVAVGPNTFTIAVTAQDGTTTKTYTVTVNRAGSGSNIPDAAVAVEQPISNPLLAEDGIVVHQGVSANGDGLNDFFKIDGITAYPDNKLLIMNRNGNLVYEARGYDNVSRKFDGRSNKTGALQLPGTYFYSLEYVVNGTIKHKTGYIILKY